MFVERLEKRFQRFGKYYLHLAGCRDDAACASIKTLGKGKKPVQSLLSTCRYQYRQHYHSDVSRRFSSPCNYMAFATQFLDNLHWVICGDATALRNPTDSGPRFAFQCDVYQCRQRTIGMVRYMPATFPH
jgi:hypothetical protein